MDSKMNWIYEAPGNNVNREDYLLGKKVDKYVDPTLQAAEREKHLLATTPGALFAGASVNTTVDLESKIREDPLFEIKKREQEAKKRLANNPIKLKQLRALVDEVKSSGKKKKKRKHKHKHSSSDDEPRAKAKGHSSKQQQERHPVRTSDNHRTRHRSRSPPGNDRQYRSTGRYSDRQERRPNYSRDRTHHREEETTVSKRLTQEELEQKRREMMSNAEWHAEKRGERVKQHRLEEEMEERERLEKAGKQEEFVDPLMAESLADATAGTLSDRIHRKIGSVQRTRAALENSFTRK